MQQEILDHNGFSKDDLKIVHVRYNLKNNTSVAFAEVVPVTFHNIMESGRVRLLWQTCKVYEDYNINRCFKCSGFNHSGKNCKKQACSKCGSTEHQESECDSVMKKCVNCTRENDKFRKQYNVEHYAYDFDSCSAYKALLNYTKSITRYV